MDARVCALDKANEARTPMPRSLRRETLTRLARQRPRAESSSIAYGAFSLLSEDRVYRVYRRARKAAAGHFSLIPFLSVHGGLGQANSRGYGGFDYFLGLTSCGAFSFRLEDRSQ